MNRTWWMESPVPALHVRALADGHAWEPNEAARRRLQQHAVSEQTMQRLAVDALELVQGEADGVLGSTSTGPGQPPLRWQAVHSSEGCVVMLLPNELPGPSLPTMVDRLDILHHYGRVGLFTRDLRTGEGRWDAAAFRLWGFEPSNEAPPAATVLERVHPEDRPHMAQRLTREGNSVGYRSERFRVCLPDGGVRHLHTMVDVQADDSGQPCYLNGVIIDDTETIERYLAQRKAAEEARYALKLADVAVWRLELASGRVYGDRTSYERTGLPYSEEGLPHEEVLAHYHPDDLPIVRQTNERALATTSVVDAVLRFRYRDDGPYRTLMTRRVAQRDAEGRPVGLVGVALDITDYVKVSSEAQALVERAERTAALAGIGFWSADTASGESEWDATMFAIHRRPSERGAPAFERWIEDYVHSDDRSRMRGLLSERRADARPFLDECRIVRTDGEVRWLEISGRQETAPTGPRLIGTAIDVTEKRATAAALRLEQQRTRFAAEALGLGVWECTLDGEPLYWNAQMYRLRGLDPRDQRPLQLLWGAAHPPVERARFDHLIQQHVRHGEVLEHELRTLWPDGTEHTLAVRGTVMAGPGGRRDRLYGVSWDITERSRAEKQLREQEAALNANRARSELVARVGRELRTPLTTVLGFTELVLKEGGMPAREREWLHQVDLAGKNLLQQVDELLGVAAPVPPAEQPAQPGTEPLRPIEGRRARENGKLTVVCIEDNAVNLMLVEELIGMRPNITLHSATDGRSGVELVNRVKPEVVLVDMHLPDWEGTEVLRRLRHEPALAHTTWIVLSANTVASDMERALEAGFHAYWTKPIDFQQFLSGLDALAKGLPVPGGTAHRGGRARPAKTSP